MLRTFHNQDGIRDDRRDGLSGLPDDVLLHILSFLPTDESVSTSLLSKRWRRVWASVPVLLFDRGRFHQSQDPTNDKFVTFVDNVIGQRDETRLDAFTLMWYESFDERKAGAWLSYASGRSVRELVLDVRPGRECQLPMDVFGGCPSLEVCRVTAPTMIWRDQQQLLWFNPTNVHLPSTVNLARLRTLDLNYVTTNKSLVKLISECPVLEELSLHLGRDIEISTPNLRTLTLFSTSNTTTVRIFAPKLTRLTCILNAAPAIRLDGLCRPVDACLYLDDWGFENIKNRNNFVGLLRSLCLANVLKLDGRFAQALTPVQDLLKKMEFNNLKNLRVETTLDPNDAKTIFMLLNGCPNLQNLVVCNTKELGRPDATGHEVDWGNRESKYSCNLSKELKEICIAECLGDDDELEFINSVFRNATCLPRIGIRYKRLPSLEENRRRQAPKLDSLIRAHSAKARANADGIQVTVRY